MNYLWRRILIPLSVVAGLTAFENITSSKTDEINTSINIEDVQQVQALPNSAGKIIQSDDGKSQITVPNNWSIQNDLNDVANLQVANPRTENYLIVISEPKADFDNISLERHSEITRGFILASLKGEQVSPPQNLNINNHPALQYKITGSIDNINVVYFHTTVETDNNFHQILAWTLPSKLNTNESILKSVINSFQEN